MSGGGKSQTSTSSVSIPPEVLARYNSVNTRAEETGNIPFQPYGGEFVAPLSQTQQAGVANINQAAGMAQPYYQGATESLLGGASQAQPYYQAATQQVAGSLAAAAPLQQASMINQLAGQQAGQQALAAGTAQSQPVYNTALTGLGNIAGVTSPLQAQSSQNILGAMSTATPMAHQAIANIMGAQGQAQPYMGAAGQALGAAASATQPIQQEAYRGIGAAQAAGSPYQELATQYGLAGARQLTPEGLSVDRYMSPYIQSVAEPTMRALRQQQQMEQQSILGDQIKGGAFGGDRGRIAQAVLAQQQGLATAKAMGDIYQQGYGQAVSTAQQQQGLQLAAEQANRLAQQQAAQQMLGIGQQGFGQNLAASQQRAALGQQLFGQGLGMAQQQAALGQQAFNQAAQTSQQQAALSQLQYGQQMGAAQAQQTLAQQLASQGLGTAQAQAGIGQQLFGQGAQAAQQLYGMGAGTAAQQAALAQQQYAQQMGAAQQLQGLGQGLYGMGAGVSQGLAGLGAGAQQAALQGGQAQLGAGQLEQQTRQAENQAYYNQFLQQQGYPYQVAQFLANVAMGTGALSGSTTTTTQPTSFFSDKRLKDDIEPIGKTYDGQDIVRYRYKGEPATRIGLVAQDVEKKHPEAVGLAGGYKTVDYDKATDAAAARAPKAYGGGLNPWGDASAYGGSVFREDAGRGYAVGGAPGGDDILAQINALVNAHQGMFPYGKAGMYGSGMGKAGPYGSTLMQAPNRGLMRAENVGTRPVSAMEGIESTVKRAENIQKMYESGKKGVDFVKTESQLSPTYTAAGQGPTQSGAALGTPTTIRDYLDSFFGGANQGTVAPIPGMYRGGLARSNYAMGGMPYSDAENEYVPEDISAPVKPQGLQPAKTPPPGRTTGDDIMTMVKLAMMAGGGGFASGGLVPRQGYTQGGGPGGSEFTIPEGFMEFTAQRESSGRSDATNRDFPPERGGPVGRYGFTERTFLDLARNDPSFEGKSQEEILAERTNPNVSAVMAARYATANAPILQRAGFEPTTQNLYLAHAQGPTGATALLSNPDRNVLDVLTDVYGNRERAMAVVTQNRGNPDMTSAQFVSRLTGSPAPGGAGIVSPENRQQAGLLPRTSTLQAREPDWMDRNQNWLVPLLTGLGTMASSPSRYLGSAILQGLAGGAQAYSGLGFREQEMALRRGQLAENQQQRELEGRRIGLQERQAGLQAWQAFLQRHQRTRDRTTGQSGWRTETGEFITNEEFARRQDRILREFGLNLSDISRPSGDVAPASNRPGARVSAPDERSATTPPAVPAQAGQPQPGAQEGAPGETAAPPGVTVPAQAQPVAPLPSDVIPIEARDNQTVVDSRAARIQQLDNIIRDQRGHVQGLADIGSPEFPAQNSILQNAIKEKEELENQDQTTASGVVYRIRPGYVEDSRPPAPVAQAPRSQIDPLTGAVTPVPVDVGYRATGGLPVPNDVPMNNVQIRSAPIITRAREAAGRASEEFMGQSARTEDAVQNMFRFATALKVLESGGTTMTRAEISNLMRGLGFDRVADTVQRSPDTAAAFTAAKTGIMNAIEVGSQAFPRMTQNEFGTLVSRAVPSADMPPDAVREIMRGQLAAAMFTAQMRRDWTAAQEQGVENFNAFSERWRRQHPPGLFMDSADRLLGNLRGQRLPSVDKLTEGIVYVMPRGNMTERGPNGEERLTPEGAISRQFGIRPGELFVVRNLNSRDGQLEFDAEKIPSNVDAFRIYRQAPALRMYGER